MRPKHSQSLKFRKVLCLGLMLASSTWSPVSNKGIPFSSIHLHKKNTASSGKMSAAHLCMSPFSAKIHLKILPNIGKFVYKCNLLYLRGSSLHLRQIQNMGKAFLCKWKLPCDLYMFVLVLLLKKTKNNYAAILKVTLMIYLILHFFILWMDKTVISNYEDCG